MKDFKNIILHSNNYSTDNFKTGLAKIKSGNIKNFSFTWQAGTRISDEVYQARIKKILPVLYNASPEIFEYEAIENGVAVKIKEV